MEPNVLIGVEKLNLKNVIINGEVADEAPSIEKKP
jgi:hypothetical protein